MSTEPQVTPGPTASGAPAPITWFEVHASDPAAAQRFFGGLFNWTFTPSGPSYQFIHTGGGPVGGIADVHPPQRPMAVFLVQVDDVAAACARAVELGGSIVGPARTMDDGLSFGYIGDPDGNVIGLWRPPAGPQ